MAASMYLQGVGQGVCEQPELRYGKKQGPDLAQNTGQFSLGQGGFVGHPGESLNALSNFVPGDPNAANP